MKETILFLVLLCCSISISGQKNKEVNLIQADNTWGQEIIKIPFWFAPEINYKGNEDIRFAKGWEDQKSDGFWTLAFAWDINLITKPTSKFFEDNLKLYYDGLMKVVNEDTKLTVPKTKARFLENKSKKEVISFTGTVETYDAFTTKKMITLNVTIENHYCKKTKKYIPLLRFSPKDFTHDIWTQLKNLTLQTNICN